MDQQNKEKPSPWQHFHGPNLGYVNQLYEQFRANPDSVSEELKAMFVNWGAPPVSNIAPASAAPSARTASIGNISADSILSDLTILKKVVAASELVQNIRHYGHLAAQIDPIRPGIPVEEEDQHVRLMDPQSFGLSDNDLQAIPAEIIWPDAPQGVSTAKDAINHLRRVYTTSLAFEFSHVHDDEERAWLNRMVESDDIKRPLSIEERISLLTRLTEVEEFERFLHRTFVGQKRFSIEGLDVLVPMIDEIIHDGVNNGARNVMIGMAHRGRLNVLAHVLGKPYEAIFSEFHRSPDKELVPSEGSMGINYGWTGDVKYHLGADRILQENGVLEAQLTLANNPSHLEFVNPVVEGFTRAAQEDRNKPGLPPQDIKRAFAILVHGDAAFPGEGIVPETLNLSRLHGYHTGGTIHIIANNRLGFTTESHDGRSTRYSSDLAKGFEIPIVHVNAEDPEACLAAANLAYLYRAKFHKDFLIDLLGYRRYGHNEADDPEATQPQMYTEIHKHLGAGKIYAKQLISAALISEQQSAEIEKTVQEKLQSALDKLKAGEVKDSNDQARQKANTGPIPDVETAVSVETLREINEDLLKWPEEFKIYPKLEKILKRRAQIFSNDNGEGQIDWATAETLALATILADGRPIRMTGQDIERGTFAHRHLVLHDTANGKTYTPLLSLPQARASFAIHNSPLSEGAVMGFEYGYDVFATEALVMWEAQFGDFANAAQVIIDQFIAAGRAKWGQKSDLVLLLPHGYEGQGPEHSSGRLERFLQSAAEDNWIVANLSSAAQYFHILRRQAALCGTDAARPLVIMTPKSLIRNVRAFSSASQFYAGQFQPILEQPGLGKQPKRVERLILCSGKVSLDLEAALDATKDSDANDWLHIARVEQLYPFPKEELKQVISRFKSLREIVWLQEEPKNMGSWNYIEPRIREILPTKATLRYVGRPDRSSPAGGFPDVHRIEQDQIVSAALKREKTLQVEAVNAGGVNQ